MAILLKHKKKILKVQKFYSILYAPLNSEKDINDQGILKNLQHPVLTDIESSNLEGEITAYEISNVLRNMKNNKSPGSDGFTVEFSKFFFKDIKHAVFASKGYLFKNIFDFTTAGDWDCVAAVERLPVLHYSVCFIFLSFGIMGFIVELRNY